MLPTEPEPLYTRHGSRLPNSEFEEYKSWIKDLVGSEEKGFSRATYDNLMSLAVYTGEKKIMAGELVDIVQELDFPIAADFEIYHLEGGRVDVFENYKIKGVLDELAELEGINEFVFSTPERKWLLFFDHYDNCKYAPG